ncbi:MAG: hypothetical protein BWX54_02359 [Verrucomicrobia bacterium ADurb.Bin018]|nr:MAG: hypothetical protein BWX54_02359 [Verrucomicrobia bacterium ADurb.Bin018]
MFATEERHIHGILYIDEIAHLLAVFIIGAVRFEEPDRAAFAHLAISLVHQRTHVALVILAGAVHIEILEARHLAQRAGAQRPQIKQVFAHAIHVERQQGGRDFVRVRITLFAVAIGGRAGGIDQARLAAQAPLGQFARVAEVVVQQIIRIGLGGGAARPEMIDHLRGRHTVCRHRLAKLGDGPDFLELQPPQVLPARVMAQIVHHQNPLHPAPIQFRHHVAADESRAARHNCPRLAIH